MSIMQGITFKDFKEFGQFLNNLDDFALAMRIYTFAENSISESEFRHYALIPPPKKIAHAKLESLLCSQPFCLKCNHNETIIIFRRL